MYAPNTDGFYYREPPQKMVFDGKRMRKPIQRKTVDYNCPMVEYLEVPQLTRTRTRPRSNLTAPVHLWLCACRIESIFAIIETTHRSNRATPISQMYVTRSRHRCFDHSTTNLGLGLGLVVQLMPPIAYEENPATSIGTHFVHTSTNKVRGPVNQVLVRVSRTRVLPRNHLRASERTALSSPSIVDA